PASCATSWSVAARFVVEEVISLMLPSPQSSFLRAGICNSQMTARRNVEKLRQVRRHCRVEAGDRATHGLGRIRVPDGLVQQLDLDVTGVTCSLDGAGHVGEVDEAIAGVMAREQVVGLERRLPV